MEEDNGWYNNHDPAVRICRGTAWLLQWKKLFPVPVTYDPPLSCFSRNEGILLPLIQIEVRIPGIGTVSVFDSVKFG